MMHESQDLIRARFVSRPNRFITLADTGKSTVTCHMPNPGRMWELLFPGTELFLRKTVQPGRKTPYDVVGIMRDGVPILLDTQYNNDTAEWLVTNHLVPGWEEWDFSRREVTVGDSRFDLLLRKGKEPFYVEVKSCTLFSRSGAMFPDAVTERGRKHIFELAEMARNGIHTGVLFLVHWDRARWFLPDYHTDPAFAETFEACEPFLDWKALALRWDATFTLPEPAGVLSFPKSILQRENHDGGDYFVVLELPEDCTLSIGSLGTCSFRRGFYVYIGSGRRNLSKRLERHQRKRKRMKWHIDYLRDVCKVTALVPVRTSDDLEHEMARDVAGIAQWDVSGFGCTDCIRDGSHLFGFKENPVHLPAFMKLVEDFRMNRLDKMMKRHKR
jgi:sugar fermentation stimulation protein A